MTTRSLVLSLSALAFATWALPATQAAGVSLEVGSSGVSLRALDPPFPPLPLSHLDSTEKEVGVGGIAPLGVLESPLSVVKSPLGLSATNEEDPRDKGGSPRSTPSVDPLVEAIEPQGRAAPAGIALVSLLAYESGIFRTIFLGLYSRIARDDLLQNAVRDRILTLVKARPGVTIREITRELGIGWGTAVYHLDRLEKGGFVVSEKHLTFRRYFTSGSAPHSRRIALSLLRTPAAEKLATGVLTHPGIRQKDLCDAYGMGPSLAHKHLERLEEVGLVRKERDGPSVRYYPEPALQEVISPSPPPLPSFSSPNLSLAVPEALR